MKGYAMPRGVGQTMIPALINRIIAQAVSNQQHKMSRGMSLAPERHLLKTFPLRGLLLGVFPPALTEVSLAYTDMPNRLIPGGLYERTQTEL